MHQNQFVRQSFDSLRYWSRSSSSLTIQVSLFIQVRSAPYDILNSLTLQTLKKHVVASDGWNLLYQKNTKYKKKLNYVSAGLRQVNTDTNLNIWLIYVSCKKWEAVDNNNQVDKHFFCHKYWWIFDHESHFQGIDMQISSLCLLGVDRTWAGWAIA